MRINSKKSIETANSVYGRFGSWKAVRSAAEFRDGKYVVAGQKGGTANATMAESVKKPADPDKSKG